MSRIIRRAFSVLPPRAGPSKPLSASHFTPVSSSTSAASTLPIAVRRRREERPATLSTIDLESGKPFPFELEKDFQSILRNAEFSETVDERGLRELFVKGTEEWRARARGYAPRGKKGRHEHMLQVMGGKAIQPEMDAELAAEREEEEESVSTSADPNQIVGQRIYLPNIQIRLMRNNTPPGESYDPYQATFRIPPSMTKTDLRSYLLAVYGLKVTFIRTDNYVAEVGRDRKARVIRKSGKNHNYKRAIVGLTEPFHYPDDLEELYAQGAINGMGDQYAEARDGWLQKNFQVKSSEEMRKRAMFKYYKGARWRSKTHANLGNTLREIMHRRKEREDQLGEEIKRKYAQGVASEAAQAQVQPVEA